MLFAPSTQETAPRGLCFNLDEQAVVPGPARELLRGYCRLRAITFSASLQGWQGLLEGYEHIELLISLEEGYHELQAVARLRQEIGSLLPILLQQQAEIRFLPGSHAKLYLLEGPAGCRTVFGSLNLSRVAWEGGRPRSRPTRIAPRSTSSFRPTTSRNANAPRCSSGPGNAGACRSRRAAGGEPGAALPAGSAG